MPQERTRKIAITGILGAITCVLGITHWGFIPWFSGASLTIMHIPAIIGAVLGGPIVGLFIGFIFGVFSMIQAAIAPTGPADVWFTNPVLAVLPRLFIGPAAWLVWRSLENRNKLVSLFFAGLIGSLVNTFLVLLVIGLLRLLPWIALPPIILVNGLPEAVLSALLTLNIVAIYKRFSTGKKQGADL